MKKLLFDLDNTILFISNDWNMIYQRFIEKYHLNTNPIELFSTIGTIEKNNPDVIITNKFFMDYMNSRLPLNINDSLLDILLEEYASIPLLNLDKMKDVLSYLSNKYELIAYTNWFTENQIKRLEINGLDKYFTKVYGWDILPVKPSKRGLEKIIGNDNIKDYIFIGDSIDYDVFLPKQMGMETIFYNRKNIVQNDYKEIKDITELKNIL